MLVAVCALACGNGVPEPVATPYTPAVPNLQVDVTRALAIENALTIQRNVGATISRVEAKLTRYRDFEAGVANGHSYVTDPDMLVWVVAYRGTNLYCGFGGPIDLGKCEFGFTVRPAMLADHVGVFGTQPAWPAWFDRLIDQSR
jgi:hypothetical protein